MFSETDEEGDKEKTETEANEEKKQQTEKKSTDAVSEKKESKEEKEEEEPVKAKQPMSTAFSAAGDAQNTPQVTFDRSALVIIVIVVSNNTITIIDRIGIVISSIAFSVFSALSSFISFLILPISIRLCGPCLLYGIATAIAISVVISIAHSH